MCKLQLLEALKQRWGSDKGRAEKLFLAALNVTKELRVLDKALLKRLLN